VAAADRFGPRVHRWAAALEEGDPLADAVAARFAADPAQLGHFHRMLAAHPGERGAPTGATPTPTATAAPTGALPTEAATPTGALPTEAAPELHALFAATSVVPPGTDHAAIARGGRLFFRTGAAGGLALGAGSLVGGYASPDGNKPLVFSRRLLDDVPRRLAETATFVVATHRPGGGLPGSEGWRLALHVRVMHAQVRRRLLLGGRWDPAWGVPLNQHDLAGTLLLFSIVWVEATRRLGWRVSRAEAEDHLALWRLVGGWMGVAPDLLPRDEPDALATMALIEASEHPPDDDARALVRALLAAGPAGRTRPARVAFAEALVRHVQGPERGDTLGLRATSARWLVPLATLPNRPLSAIAARSRRAEAFFVASGEHYWRTTGGADVHAPAVEGPR
jgi:hypothetical protein